MFVPDESRSEFCFASTLPVPTGSRAFASFTPLLTAKKPATPHTTRKTKTATSVTHVHRFHVQPLRSRRTTCLPEPPSEPPPRRLRYVVRSRCSAASRRSRDAIGTFPFVRPP